MLLLLLHMLCGTISHFSHNSVNLEQFHWKAVFLHQNMVYCIYCLLLNIGDDFSIYTPFLSALALFQALYARLAMIQMAPK